ncbi:MAG: gamma-glutamyltransferase [Oceanicaulis sp.]|uniref:gamma-glutamyltransferase n=2 Tax=Oceanicaulis TaxID=153232 RepID=UPI000C3DC875|nr:gamma-glutamyltransferase [Oceanicaulis sp. UBA6590]MAB70432.1 gamma-glutamyltransferase [Oceanicaulis sp.]MBG37331.1 gamma-glutamyltransferase [Oceanicaulis sp.]HCR93634.1 gamma-glutamyltransferase [Oceanicaulis sp.]|tara:strand:- start:1028 stop:2797 length:1770 start_codon:yes stop_codon:yes gene_type:complete
MNKIAAAGMVAAMAFSEFGASAGAQDFYPGDRVSGDHFATRSPVTAVHGMAATAHPLATQIALDILKSGGNAVDAAIAANAALGLMEPTGNGIGGDIFVIVYDPETRQVYGLNGAGRSPLGLSYEEVVETVGEDGAIPPLGAMPVSVPGTVDGWYALHERFGEMPMDEVLAPTIRYAEEGFPLTQTIAYYWDRNMSILEARHAQDEIEEFDNARATYLTEDGDAPREGEIFRNPDLASTLRQIAEGGRDAFYEGEIARTIDAYMQRIGGWIRYEDLANHRSEWVEPVSVNYRGYDVWELPPQGQGIAALQMLQILEDYDLASMGFMSADALHVQIEAKRLAFEDRARFYADPDFAPAPVEALLSEEYAAERRALISMDQAMQSVTHGDPAILEDGDTTYLTVADGNGMMVSLIQSNFRGMGSGLVPDGLGFMFQDRGELFSLDPNHPNVYAPGKRPFHTIIPAMITQDGDGVMSFGLMGGGMQPQGHVQIVSNIIDFGLNVQEAGDTARWRHEGSTSETGAAGETAGVGVVHLESGVPAEVRAELEARGHVIGASDGGFGGYQAIWRDRETGVLYGASEMRKDGNAQGY